MTTIREPGAACAGRTGTRGVLSVLEALAHADSASAQAARASAALASVLDRRLDAVERVDDRIRRVTEVEGNGGPPVLHRLEHGRAELHAGGAELAGLVARAPAERPAPLRLHARQLPPHSRDLVRRNADPGAHPCSPLQELSMNIIDVLMSYVKTKGVDFPLP